jgi:Transposase DDE domain
LGALDLRCFLSHCALPFAVQPHRHHTRDTPSANLARAGTWAWIWETYRLRFQIEFVFRDGKQHIGLTHCQSTNKVKMENHLNLSLTAVNVAKVCHWKHEMEGETEPFSMADIKSYYQNLNLLNRISCALNLNQEEILNNPKIINILFSSSYENIAA